MTAVVALSTGLELSIGTFLWLVVIALIARWDYKRVCKRWGQTPRDIQKELEEREEDWGWPAKDQHVGKTRVGEKVR